MFRGLGVAFVSVLMLVVVAGCSPATDKAVAAARPVVTLGVPHLAQENLLCVPTSAAMVLAFYGDPQPPRKLKALSLGKTYRPGEPFTDYSITPFAALIEGIAPLGYRWQEISYPQTPDGFRAGMKQIEADLDAGRPPLVDISRKDLGHTVVVFGYDPDRRLLFVADPGAPAPGRYTMTYDAFEAVWNENAYGGNFRALMRTADRKS